MLELLTKKEQEVVNLLMKGTTPKKKLHVKCVHHANSSICIFLASAKSFPCIPL